MPNDTNPSGITPLGIAVLIQADTVEETTPGGIIIPASEKEKFDQAQKTGVIVALGPLAGAELGEPWAQVGDRVVHSRYSGEHLTGEDGRLYRLLNDDQVWALAADGVMLGELDRYESRKAYG